VSDFYGFHLFHIFMAFTSFTLLFDLSRIESNTMRRRPCPKSMSCNAISVSVLLFSLCTSNFALVTNAFTIPNPSWKVSSAHVPSSRRQSVNFDLTPRRTRLPLQAAAASSDLIPARRARVAFELKTLFRVLIPAILSGTAAFLTLPTLCFRVAMFVTHTTDPSKIGMLSDIVQSFISLVGLLYSIMMGQVFGFLYSQQEVRLFSSVLVLLSIVCCGITLISAFVQYS
jgi:hypothetical protein